MHNKKKYCETCAPLMDKKVRQERYFKTKENGKVLEYRENSRKSINSAREWRLRNYYGITGLEYDDLLEKQKHCCAVCGRHQSEFKINLAVDHDHNTLEIRGLLCSHCNRHVIGRHRDPEVFRRAANYLDGPFSGLFVPKNAKKNKTRRKRRKT